MQIIELNSDSRCDPGVETAFHPLLTRIVNHRFAPLSRRAVEYLNDAIFGDPPPLQAWKHCATNFEDASRFDAALVLFTVRHPASWALSLFKRPYHQLTQPISDLPTFLSTPWKTTRRERLNRASYLPLELYQVKLRSYRDFAARLAETGIRSSFIRHEDIVMQQDEVFEQLAPRLIRPNASFVPLRRGTKYPYTATLDEFRRYYGEERWRADVEPVKDLVNAQVNWDDFAEFGYDRLD